MFQYINASEELFAQSGNWFMPNRGPPYVLAATKLNTRVMNFTPNPVNTI